MKTVFFLIIMIASSAFGSFGNYYPVGKSGAKTVYKAKASCEQKESQKCYSITNKDMRRWMVGDVDDLEKPKYLKKDVAACSDRASCDPLLEALDCSVHAEGSFAVMALDFSEVYCAEPNGFEQKKDLVSDPAGIIAADAEDAQKVTDDSTRAIKKSERVIELDQCVQGTVSGILTLPEASACIRAVVRELRGNGVDPADL